MLNKHFLSNQQKRSTYNYRADLTDALSSL